jgi:hypothetical protein
MISPETRVQIRRYFYAEHWKIGTIAPALNVHPDTVRRAIEVERFQHAEPLRPFVVDPYLPFVREVVPEMLDSPGVRFVCIPIQSIRRRKIVWLCGSCCFGVRRGCAR